jgi:putative oxidoreductase
MSGSSVEGKISATVIFMIFPQLTRFLDVALLLMRFMVGVVFMTSGFKDLKNPQERSKDIEMSKGFTIFLRAAEFAAGLGVIVGFSPNQPP